MKAFQDETLELEEWERAAARALYHFSHVRPTADRLIEVLDKYGHKVDGVLETALILDREDYDRVVEHYNTLPDEPKRRKR